MATTYDRPAAQVRTASGLNLLAGLWMLLSPWLLGFSAVGNAAWNAVIAGLLIAVFAMARIAAPDRAETLSWLSFLLGIWLVVSPFLLDFGDVYRAMWNGVIVGLLVQVLSAWSAVATPGAAIPPRTPPSRPGNPPAAR